LRSGLTDAGQRRQQPGFGPVDIYFLRSTRLFIPGNGEFQPSRVSAAGQAARRFQDIIDAVSGLQRIKAGIVDLPADVYLANRFVFRLKGNLDAPSPVELRPDDGAAGNDNNYKNDSRNRPPVEKPAWVRGWIVFFKDILDLSSCLPFG
jgi:hypothetical protein